MVFLQLRLFAEQKPLLHMPDIDWPGWNFGHSSVNCVPRKACECSRFRIAQEPAVTRISVTAA
jgi:hypothetical protein